MRHNFKNLQRNHPLFIEYCQDGINSFTCNCKNKYFGIFCQFERYDCNSLPCQNGGTCIETFEGFKCDCNSPEFYGSLCQHKVNLCSSSPCDTNGICHQYGNSWQCFCQKGFSGKTCLYEIDECFSIPCLNGGNCVDQKGYRVVF